MVRFIRNYSIASLVGIVVAAVAMIVMFRAVLIRGITTIAESSSVASARIALHPIVPQLVDYLNVAAATDAMRGPRRCPRRWRTRSPK